MKMVTLRGGEEVPCLGLGTWKMGAGMGDQAEQVKALQTGIGLGMTLIDTAEMYGDGAAEMLVGKAVAGRRDSVFIVSKVLPSNASRRGTAAACEASLKRLATDRIDLYLLHWRGQFPLAETAAALAGLKAQGKIRHFGVSNFDAADMAEWNALGPHAACAANQVQYNVEDRGIEFDLIPAMAAQGTAVMAYCPLGGGRLAGHPALQHVAHRHGVTPAAVALAFTIRLPGMISIPKSIRKERVAENAKALDISLSPEDLAEIDAAFPPPRRKVPLAMT